MSHPALSIPEVLLIIFAETQQNTEPLGSILNLDLIQQEASDNRATLYAITRVSKAFSEPALDLLWKELPSPEPLLRLLPALAGDTWPPISNPTPNDWNRFASYATRVRSIGCTCGSGVREWPLILERLCSAPGTPHPLVPRLRQLFVPRSFLYPGSLIGTPLLKLVISEYFLPHNVQTVVRPPGQAIPPWILSLPQTSPALQCLVLEWGQNLSLADQQILMRVVLELKMLKSLVFNALSQLSIESLSILSTSGVLEELNLKLRGADLDAWKLGAGSTSFRASTAFAGLKNLCLEIGVFWSEWDCLLQQFFSSAPLHTLRITPHATSLDDIFLSLPKWLAATYSSTLHTLGVHILESKFSTALPLPMHVLQPLLAIRGIHSLFLQGLFDLDNSDLLDIGRSLEGLIALSLSPGRVHVEVEPKLTLVGVQGLTQLRPSLEYLGLSINLAAEAPSCPPSINFKPSHLKTLSLGSNSTIGKVEDAYVFIQGAWPALADLDINDDRWIGQDTEIDPRFHELAKLVSNGELA